MTLYGVQDASPLTLLCYVLNRDYGMNELPELRRTPLGKPYFPACPAIQFSWSHSDSLLICAVSPFPVGVDIERIRPRRTALPAYALTRAERERYDALGGDWSAFYTLWTRKEAWCKYTGEGLRAHWGEAPPENGLSFGSYGGDHWRAAVCGEEPPPKDIEWLRKEDLDAAGSDLL